MPRRCKSESFLVACAGLIAMPLAAPGGTIEWQSSYDEARKSAKESGDLMMVDFYADW